MMLAMGLLALLLGFMLFQRPVPFACEWTRPVEIGRVKSPITEDSGLAVSRRYPDRLYHVNDSGDTGRFFITDLAGGHPQRIEIAGFTPSDTEDIALGPCGATDCLFIADIGNNSGKRRTLDFVAIEEKENFGFTAEPKYRVRIRYPGPSLNAESFAVHPNGDVFIITKGGIPELYRLKKDQWMNAGNKAQVLERLAVIDFQQLGGAAALIDGRRPTGMDIAPDGKSFLVLTYRNVFEMFFDLSQPLPDPNTWKAGTNFRRIDVEVLQQQEAIAYMPDGKSFIYDTEKGSKGHASIMRSDCR